MGTFILHIPISAAHKKEHKRTQRGRIINTNERKKTTRQDKNTTKKRTKPTKQNRKKVQGNHKFTRGEGKQEHTEQGKERQHSR